jgi:hypothetical protein
MGGTAPPHAQENRPVASWPIELVADIVVVTMQAPLAFDSAAARRRSTL